MCVAFPPFPYINFLMLLQLSLFFQPLIPSYRRLLVHSEQHIVALSTTVDLVICSIIQRASVQLSDSYIGRLFKNTNRKMIAHIFWVKISKYKVLACGYNLFL